VPDHGAPPHVLRRAAVNPILFEGGASRYDQRSAFRGIHRPMVEGCAWNNVFVTLRLMTARLHFFAGCWALLACAPPAPGKMENGAACRRLPRTHRCGLKGKLMLVP
jgi:hypothetical protein